MITFLKYLLGFHDEYYDEFGWAGGFMICKKCNHHRRRKEWDSFQ